MKPLTILYVEDSDDDVLLLRKACEATDCRTRIEAVHDGEVAINYFKGEGLYADRSRFPIPNVILTDLKMPLVDGFGLLQWLKGNDRYCVIPTVVFSSSYHGTDVSHAYHLGATAFFAKPADFRSLVRFMKVFEQYWSLCLCPEAAEKDPRIDMLPSRR